MHLSQVREKLYEIIAMFFAEATVIWAEQVATKPLVPYVTIKTSSVNKSLFPCVDEETGMKYYPCSTIAELNLYTKGKLVNVSKNVTENYENTALDDMMDFVKFIESEAVTDIIVEDNLDIQIMPPIRDLSELMNDTKYRYRSMAEFTISYMEETKGLYGIAGSQQIPNSSGGGYNEHRREEYYFEEVEIKEGKISE